LKPVDFGPVREAYHKRWPSAMHDAISALVQPMPRVQRQIFFRALYEEIDRRIDAGEKVTPEQVPDVLAALQGAGQKRTAMKRAI
jgi:N-methylhydantoinase B